MLSTAFSLAHLANHLTNFGFVSPWRTGVQAGDELGPHREDHRADGDRFVDHPGRIHPRLDVHAGARVMRPDADAGLDPREGADVGDSAAGKPRRNRHTSLTFGYAIRYFLHLMGAKQQFHAPNRFGVRSRPTPRRQSASRFRRVKVIHWT